MGETRKKRIQPPKSELNPQAQNAYRDYNHGYDYLTGADVSGLPGWRPQPGIRPDPSVPFGTLGPVDLRRQILMRLAMGGK